jgi:hypothetical protein
MTPLFKKLNYKAQTLIACYGAPASFLPELKAMKSIAPYVLDADAKQKQNFIIIFCITQKQVDAGAKLLKTAANADAIVWFCYPKMSSKKYTCEFNRDTGWAKLGAANWEPVRAVAIDDDWTALRFKPAVQIRTMTRGMAISEEGKAKSKLDERSYELFCKLGDAMAPPMSHMFGKKCYKKNGKAFMMFFDDSLVVKLGSQDFEKAGALSGAHIFNPMGKGKGMTGWLVVPFMHRSKWQRLVDIAYAGIA